MQDLSTTAVISLYSCRVPKRSAILTFPHFYLCRSRVSGEVWFGAAESSLTPETEGRDSAVSRHADATDGEALNRRDRDFLLVLMELTLVYLGAISAEALNRGVALH